MAGIPVTAYEEFWLHEVNSLQSEYKDIVAEHPDAAHVMEQVHKVLGDIVCLAGCAPATVGMSKQWAAVVKSAEQDRRQLCNALKGKLLFSALYGTYTVTLGNLKEVLQASASRKEQAAPAATSQEATDDGFREQRRRKRNSSNTDTPQQGKKKPVQIPAQTKIPTVRNYFAPLQTPQMDAEETESPAEEQTRPNVSGRPPPIVLTSAVNLIHLQKELKGIVKGSFEFRSTRNGTRVVTREMADYSAIKDHFDSKAFHYFTFHPKSEKPIKAVIRHLPMDTPAEDLSKGLQDLGFSVLSVKQMTASRPSPEGGSRTSNLPLFLITLTRNPKSQEIFQLTSICHIMVRVEAYRAQNALTQCYNCQKFGHIWVNCRQPPRCMWCGGGHLHKECPESGKESVPSCCNCSLKEGEKPHPSNYRGCSHAKEESLRRRSQRTTPKEAVGRKFSSRPVLPGKSFAAALRGKPQQQQQPRTEPAERIAPLFNPKHQMSGQSVQAPSVCTSSLDDMFKVAAIVQQIMTELNGAVSEESKIVAITKIVLNLMKQNGH
jgi:hypothetical protein